MEMIAARKTMSRAVSTPDMTGCTGASESHDQGDEPKKSYRRLGGELDSGCSM